MAKVYLEDSTLTAIGNAIREKAGNSNLLLPSEMASAITNLPSGGGDLVFRYATITPTSDATSIDLSPWITDANIDDWFIFGGFGYWGMADIASVILAPKCMGPLFRNFTPTKGTTSAKGWVADGFGHESVGVPTSATTAGLKWDYQGISGYTTRCPDWNPTTKTLTVSNTRNLGKQQMILVYREV